MQTGPHHASSGDLGQSATDPPKSVERRIRGFGEALVPPAPGAPWCAMGLPREGAALVPNEVGPAPWRELEFEMGRRRYDAQFLAEWRALFERAVGPAYRLLLREHGGAPRPDHGLKMGRETTRAASEAALRVIPLSAPDGETASLLRAYAVEIPGAVIRAIGMRPELLGRAGPGVGEPLGALPGMVFTEVARASCSARVKWSQSIRWGRMSHLLRGVSPAPPPLKVSHGKPPKGLAPVVSEKAFGKQYGLAPARPGDRNRVCQLTVVRRPRR